MTRCRQCRARFPFRRQRGGRRGVRPCRHVTRLELRANRIVVNAMEPRSAIAQYDHARGTGRSTSAARGVRLPQLHRRRLRRRARQGAVLTDRVGGSFGMKQANLSRALLPDARRARTRPPVKWTDERSGSFCLRHGWARCADDRRTGARRGGNFLAVRLTGYGNLGATYGAPGPRPAMPYATRSGFIRRRSLRSAPNASSRRRRRSAPIAAPAGRKRITTWSGWSRRRRPKWASTASSCAAAITSRFGDAVQVAQWHDL